MNRIFVTFGLYLGSGIHFAATVERYVRQHVDKIHPEMKNALAKYV